MVHKVSSSSLYNSEFPSHFQLFHTSSPSADEMYSRSYAAKYTLILATCAVYLYSPIFVRDELVASIRQTEHRCEINRLVLAVRAATVSSI